MPAPSRTYTSIQLSGTLRGTSPTYIISVQTDDGTANHFPSGTQVAAGQQVSFPGSYYSGSPAFAMSPGNLNAGQIYHIVLSYYTGLVNGSNYFGPFFSQPNNLAIPVSQASDPNLDAIDFNGTAWTSLASEPKFILGFTDGSYFGCPYDSYQIQQVYGMGATAVNVAEHFVAPASVYAGSLGVWIKKVGNPTGNLSYEVDDLTALQTLGGNPFITPAMVSTTDSWVDVPFSFPFTIPAGDQIRVWFSTPAGGTDAADYYEFDSSTTTGPSTLTFGGTNCYLESSSDGGSSWLANTAADMGFRFAIAPTPTPTWTPQNTYTPNPTATPPCAPAFGTFGLATANTSNEIGGGQVRGSKFHFQRSGHRKLPVRFLFHHGPLHPIAAGQYLWRQPPGKHRKLDRPVRDPAGIRGLEHHSHRSDGSGHRQLLAAFHGNF